MKIGVLGSSGFIGTNLKNEINRRENHVFVYSDRSFFMDTEKMDYFLEECEVVVLLSAACRGSDEEIYEQNMFYVKQLLSSYERLGIKGKKKTVVFPSSIQENEASAYGKSKRDGRLLLQEQLDRLGINFLRIILPNIFGPHAKVNYASFIATFSFNIWRNKANTILVNRKVLMLFVDDFVRELFGLIEDSINNPCYFIAPRHEYFVSEVLERLTFLQGKGGQGIRDTFDYQLFKTLISYKGGI